MRLYRCGVLFLVLSLISACTSVPISPAKTPSALNPGGPGAAHLASLCWVMLVLSTATFVLVLVLLFVALRRRRRATSETPPDSHGGAPVLIQLESADAIHNFSVPELHDKMDLVPTPEQQRTPVMTPQGR